MEESLSDKKSTKKTIASQEEEGVPPVDVDPLPQLFGELLPEEGEKVVEEVIDPSQMVEVKEVSIVRGGAQWPTGIVVDFREEDGARRRVFISEEWLEVVNQALTEIEFHKAGSLGMGDMEGLN